MACDTRSTNIFLEASNVSWGKEEVVCIDPVQGLTGGEYFVIASQAVEYYVWTDVDNGSTDPAPAGKTAIEVDVSAGYSIADWIAAFKVAAEATGDFFVAASSDGLSAQCTTIKVGVSQAAATDVDSGFTIATDITGTGGDLGKTKEGIEVSFEATLFDVKGNQSGELLLDQIIQGTSASASMSLLEMTEEKWALIVGDGLGDKLTPGGGTEVIGFGSSKNFQSTFDSAGKLVLHPIRLPASDRSKDVVFWKTLPLPESINYDGTDSQAMSVSFNALVDETRDSKINIFAFGDHEQDLRA